MVYYSHREGVFLGSSLQYYVVVFLGYYFLLIKKIGGDVGRILLVVLFGVSMLFVICILFRV